MSRDDEDLLRTATAFSTRQQLDCLLLEALTAPGMARDQVDRIVELSDSGQLERAEQAIAELCHTSSREQKGKDL